MTDGVAGLLRDKTRPSHIPPLEAYVAARVVSATQTDPPGETTHWTAATMAERQGISVSSVERIWRRHGLQPPGAAVQAVRHDRFQLDTIRRTHFTLMPLRIPQTRIPATSRESQIELECQALSDSTVVAL